jgi:hypothetical protein
MNAGARQCPGNGPSDAGYPPEPYAEMGLPGYRSPLCHAPGIPVSVVCALTIAAPPFSVSRNWIVPPPLGASTTSQY